MLQVHLQDSPVSNENENENEGNEDDFDDNDYLDEIDPRELLSNDMDQITQPLPLFKHSSFSKSSSPNTYTTKGIKSELNVSYISNKNDRNTKFKKCLFYKFNCLNLITYFPIFWWFFI